MIPLQLAFAITQITAASLSALILIATRPKSSKIALPIFADEPLDGSHGHQSNQATDDGEEELEGGETADQFDVSKPIDFIDGVPIEEDEFWARMRARKILQTIVIAILVCLDAIASGWMLAVDEVYGRDETAVTFLQLGFSIYILALSITSIRQNKTSTHWTTTVHLWALTVLTTSLYLVRLLLPTTARPRKLETIYDLISLIIYTTLTINTSNTPSAPPVHFPAERIYSAKTLSSSAPTALNNVSGMVNASIWSLLLFSYTTPVMMLGYTSASLEIKDLPIVPSDMRASRIFSEFRSAYKSIKIHILGFNGWRQWKPKPGSGWDLVYKMLKVNRRDFAIQMALAASTAILYYVPAYFLQQLIAFLEVRNGGGADLTKVDRSWGWVYCAGLFFSNAINYIIAGQLWSISTTTIQVRLKVQLNTLLFAKTLVRKDVAGTSPPSPTETNATTPRSTHPASPTHSSPTHGTGPLPSEGGTSTVNADAVSTATTKVDAASTKSGKDAPGGANGDDEFSSKAQIMTLMTTDVDRVSDFAWHLYSLVDAPIEIVIGSMFLYYLLGVSAFIGLAVTGLFLPINHYASKIVISAQDNLMKSRDERVGLMNEILGGIRMLKFMAWERSFEKRVLKVREKELHYQKRNYYIEALFNAVWNASPVLVTLVAFWHFTVVRGRPLTPSIAFTSLSVFNELKFALNALPETFVSMLQSFVSVRRIENYLHGQEVEPVQPLSEQASMELILNCATISWPAKTNVSSNAASSAAPTPKYKFTLRDLTLHFPKGELSLVCGKLGSGKTLLLQALLGEADLLTGQIICPRTPPDCLARFSELSSIPPEKWVVPGVCAYVPQTAWLQNASIKENILFNLPFDEERYQQTLEACALVTDLTILEDGDEAEIGERGVNLSGGQKARVSFARAIYSRASVLFLDDVLSAVDAHTAQHLYEHALRGPLLKGRTVILVSHHVQLCTPGAAYIVALNNGKLIYSGDRDGFKASGVMAGLVQSTDTKDEKAPEPSSAGPTIDQKLSLESNSTVPLKGPATSSSSQPPTEKKKPRKLIDDEQRAVGRISRKIWETYARAVGGALYWIVFGLVLIIGAASPVVENGWLKHWSGKYDQIPGEEHKMEKPLYYIGVYAGLTMGGLVFQTLRWIILYQGSIHASTILYKRLLKAVLFAHIRFHDTTNRGRLLNRFGKDFEGIDSGLADNFGRTVMYSLSVFTTFLTITWVGGLGFLIAILILGIFYFEAARVYGQVSRDVRRLDSTTRSPLYTIYGESISGVGVLRAFGASTKFLREMQQHVDTNTNPYYWMWGVNRWLSTRFNILSSAVVGVTGVVLLLKTDMDASTAGFALAFASTVTNDLLFMVRRFVGLEQSMVALERIQEFTDLSQEPPEFIEPRPPASWPHEGSIEADNLVIRYAPDLPNVLHGLNFTVTPGQKIGVLGRTGGGKSTLALSFFRFVEATEGKIIIDGVDISKIGLTDLRSRLTIIPQDPTILSGSLRSTLDVFDEYSDAEIYEALRRVHLIPSDDQEALIAEEILTNANAFRNLDSPVAEGGENFSAGEKQLICMARAILKRSKVLFMDEATASVDYATDELISKTIRKEFAQSTILTIAHRLRTVIDYDKVMLLDQGRIVEFDRPSVLLSDSNSKFYSLCQSAGPAEFAVLRRLASEASRS